MAHRNFCEQSQVPEVIYPIPQRPQTFLQRISSILGSFPPRKSTPKQRPKSAPILRHTSSTCRPTRAFSREGDQEVLLPPKLKILPLANEPCPNDSEVYYSFPNNERKRCSSLLCGLGTDCTAAETAWPNNATASILQCTQSRPCTPGRAGIACEHLSTSVINNVSRHVSLSNNKMPSVTVKPPAVSRTSTPFRVRFSDQGDREPSVSRLPALNTLTSSRGPSPVARPPTRRGRVPYPAAGVTFDTLKETICSWSPETRDSPSPKLHHVFGSRDRPYVHRHEAKQYLASLRAAGQPNISVLAPSSLDRPHTTLAAEGRPRARSDVTDYDYSQTVFYPCGGSPVLQPRKIKHTKLPISSSIFDTPSGTTNIQEVSHEITSNLAKVVATTAVDSIPASSSIIVDISGRPIPVNLELETSNVYRKHDNDDDTRHDEDSSSHAETPSTLCGKRLELRGGNVEAGCTPWLRGGGRQNVPKSFSSIILKMKKATLTCCDEGCTDDDDPPSRIHIPCPKSHCRHRIKIPLPRIPGAHWQSGSDRVPQLRGGTRISRPNPTLNFDENDRLHAGLWYLAGGCGPPVTAQERNKLRPKERLGGQIGMTMYGHKAGLASKDNVGESLPAVAMNFLADVGSNSTSNPASSSQTLSRSSSSIGASRRGPAIKVSIAATARQTDGGNAAPNGSTPGSTPGLANIEPHNAAAAAADLQPDTSGQNDPELASAAVQAVLSSQHGNRGGDPVGRVGDGGNHLGLLD